MNHLVHRIVSLAACGAAVALCSTPASGAPVDPAVACEPAYVAYGKAIEAEKAGHLRQARNDLMTCALSSCGELVPRCRERHKQLGLEMASIVRIVTDETGATRVDVQVTIDGEPLTSRLDGPGLPVEPGLHEFAFSMDGRIFHTEKILIVEGQRNRVISVTRDTKVVSAKAAPMPDKAVPARPPPADESPPPRESASANTPAGEYSGKWTLPRSPAPYILGAVGVAAVTAGALTTYWGNKDNSALESQCSPDCQLSSQYYVKTLYVASDVSFGVGLAALAVTTWLFASSREKTPSPSAPPSVSVTVLRRATHPIGRVRVVLGVVLSSRDEEVAMESVRAPESTEKNVKRPSLVLLLAAPAVLAVPAWILAGCFQSFDPGTARSSSQAVSPDTDAGTPAVDAALIGAQCADNSAECADLCGFSRCALPDAAIPPFLDVPVIVYQPDGSTAGFGSAAPGTSTTDPCVAVEAESLVIRQRSCAPCHGPPPAPGFNGFDYVLDDMTLANHPDNEGDGKIMVIPGDPADSYVYQRVVTGLAGPGSGGMPPNPIGSDLPPEAGASVVYPTPADVSVLYGWILNCIVGADGGAYTSTYYGGSFGPAGDGGFPGDAGAARD